MKKYIGILIVILFFGGSVFAQSADTASGTSSFLQNIFKILQTLQLVWIIPAAIAGQLMSNDIVTGSAFGMTEALSKLWRIMENFSFMILAFLFVQGVFKVFISKDSAFTSIKNLVSKIAISTVLISSSWFIIYALLDISNILTFTASGFFQGISQKINGNPDVGFGNLCIFDKNASPTCLKSTSSSSTTTPSTTTPGTSVSSNDYSVTLTDKGSKLDDWFPKVDSLAGPLVYLGKGILQVDKYSLAPASTDIKSISAAILLQAAIFILFLVPVVLLIGINFIRLFWIWLWLALAPIIIISNIFNWKLNIKGFEFKNILALVFQPVLIVVTMSLAIIFLTSMKNILVGSSNTSSHDFFVSINTPISNGNSYGNDTYSVKLAATPTSDSIIQNAGSFIGFLIMSMFAVALVWFLLKAGTATNDLTGGFANGITGFVESFVKSVPIVPLAGGISYTAMQRSLSSSSIASNTFRQKDVEGQNRLERLFHINNDGDLGPSDVTLVSNELGNGTNGTSLGRATAGFSKLRDIVKDKAPFTIQNSTRLKQTVENIMNTLTDEDMVNLGIISDKSERANLRTFGSFMSNQNAKNFIGIMLGFGKDSKLNIKDIGDAAEFKPRLNDAEGTTAGNGLETKKLGKKS